MALKHLRAIMDRITVKLGFEEPSLTEISRKTRDPFQVLISCILSLRTRDETTRAASKRLFTRCDTPQRMQRLKPGTIEKAIYPVGFYRTKALRIIEICKKLIKDHEGRVPDTLEELLALPGVGPKTANIVLVYGFRKPGLPIDTHCHRIPNRIGWVKTKTPEETEQVLRKTLPKKYWMSFNDCFVQFGQNVCKPIGPRCNECVIEKFCEKNGVVQKG
ncbi:MAG: endonuclease III [Planctomycetes bacterium]|nr:endonuclease III [Planctomycetota bacterium]